jgi:hypothetical protein
LFKGFGVADGVIPGVAVGLALGVALGTAVGEAEGDTAAAGLEVVWAVLALFAGVGARIPEGIPGAAGRSPSGLASVDPVLFGAGPAVAGAFADSPLALGAPV